MTAILDDVDEGLAWTSEGCVGVWRLGTADSVGVAPVEHLVGTWERLTAGISQLPRSTVLHGATRPLNTAMVAAKVTGTTPAIEREPRGVAHLAAGKWERIVYATALLEESSSLRATADRIRAYFGLHRVRAGERSHSRLRRKRDLVGAAAGDLRLLPATVDEILWLFSRIGTTPRIGSEAGGTQRVRLIEGFGESGRSRRWVLADDGVTTKYHSILVVEHMSHWLFPGGGEWWRACDMLPFPVEWSVHLDLVPNREARNRLGRRLAELDYQDEKEHEYESATPRELVKAIDTVEAAIDQGYGRQMAEMLRSCSTRSGRYVPVGGGSGLVKSYRP